MTTNFSVLFDNNQDTFSPGSVVNGHLIIECNEAISSIEEIIALCIGKARVIWTESHGKNSTTYVGNEKYCKLESVLLNGNSIRNELGRGQHRFPFSFVLPTDIPPSFKFHSNARAYVRYSVKGRVMRSGLSSNVKTKERFFVTGPGLLSNQIPGFIQEQPSSGRDSKYLCCWCCKSGPINGEIATNKSGYAPGETINITAQVENLTNTDILTTKLNLKVRATLRAKWKTRTFDEKIVKLDCESCSRRRTLSLNNRQLQIPLMFHEVPLATSGLPHCNIIQTVYLVELEGLTGACHINLRVPAEIVIGSSPSAASDPPPPFPSVQEHALQPSTIESPPSYQTVLSSPAHTQSDPPATQQQQYYNWNEQNQSAFTYGK